MCPIAWNVCFGYCVDSRCFDEAGPALALRSKISPRDCRIVRHAPRAADQAGADIKYAWCSGQTRTHAQPRIYN